MNYILNQLESIIREYPPLLKQLSEDDWTFKPAPGKWSRKEVMGHLVDSAQNNIRRFIVAQYEEVPHIVYNQDKWVAIGNHQDSISSDLIDLWILLNKHMISILKNLSLDSQERLCRTNSVEPRTVKWLASDYIKHLLHHLHQVLNREPVDYP